MGGTLAVWCEEETSTSREPVVGPYNLEGMYDRPQATRGDAITPRLELHVNLWRDIDPYPDFLDIGFKLQFCTRVRRLALFLPELIPLDRISDLSPLLRHGLTLNAVFNDVLEITNRSDTYFDISRRGDSFTRIHHFDRARDIVVEPIALGGSAVGATVVFNEAFCRRLQDRTAQSHYIRLRIEFDDRRDNFFSTEQTPSDWWLLSSFKRIERTEFKLNERRSLPQSISNWFEKSPLRLERVHYFLIRHLRYELILQHQDFRKVRMLERGLWLHYLRGTPPESKDDFPDDWSSSDEEPLVIYHWKEADEENGLDDFGAFAKFQAPKPNLSVYAFAIVLFGVLGSAIHSFFVEVLRRLVPGSWGFWRRSGLMDQNSGPIAIVLLFFVLVSLPMIWKYLWAGKKAKKKPRYTGRRADLFDKESHF